MTSQKRSKLAIASIIGGFAGFLFSTFSIVAVICGHIALSKIKNNPEMSGDATIAKVGLVCGYIGLAKAIIVGILRSIAASTLNSL